jgi:2-iminobutanoate/2-iminopropanoate deaminase
MMPEAKAQRRLSHSGNEFAAENQWSTKKLQALCYPLRLRFDPTGNWGLIFMRSVISTKDAPQAIGPYSQAIKANGWIFCSGQVAIDPATQQVISGDVAAQTDRVLRNLSEILEAAGSGLGKVLKTTVFLKNMSDFARMNEVYGKYFTSAPPARSTVEVARLPKDVLVEIDVIALE